MPEQILLTAALVHIGKCFTSTWNLDQEAKEAINALAMHATYIPR